MGLIWLKQPVLWHSSRVPSGYDYSKMTDEQKEMIITKWHNWYTADWDYGQTTIIFFCVGLGLLGLFNVMFFLSNVGKKAAASSALRGSRPTIFQRILGFSRWFTTRQVFYRGDGYHWQAAAASVGHWRFEGLNYYSHSVGVWTVVGMIFTFTMGLLLAAKPYYWPNDEMGHSPPIATRAGWISIAIMPFMIAFATKVNWIGALVGTSHEKLQVFHRWTALFMYITSLVHTFPFIIHDIMMGEMMISYGTSPWYWTGVAALIPQTWLVLMSWGIFRNPYYETFKKLHFIAGGIFMAALWIHCNFRLTSWDYFWATAALYFTAYFFRIVRTLYNSNVFGISSKVSLFPDNIMRVSIPVSGKVGWKPGQHVFLRFLDAGLHAFTSHPFTIASVRGGVDNSSDDSLLESKRSKYSLDVFFRVRGGSTASLAGMLIEHEGTARVLVDGPYGGVPVDMDKFDTVLLFAGGIGSTFTLPILMDLIHKRSARGVDCKILFVVVVRKKEALGWMAKDLAIAAKAASDHDEVALQIHVTGNPLVYDKGCDIESGLDDRELPLPKGYVQTGRPSVHQIVDSICHDSGNGRVGIAACGPDTLLYDVRNAVAGEQLRIAKGQGTASEVFLHTEHYSW